MKNLGRYYEVFGENAAAAAMDMKPGDGEGISVASPGLAVLEWTVSYCRIVPSAPLSLTTAAGAASLRYRAGLVHHAAHGHRTDQKSKKDPAQKNSHVQPTLIRAKLPHFTFKIPYVLHDWFGFLHIVHAHAHSVLYLVGVRRNHTRAGRKNYGCLRLHFLTTTVVVILLTKYSFRCNLFAKSGSNRTQRGRDGTISTYSLPLHGRHPSPPPPPRSLTLTFARNRRPTRLFFRLSRTPVKHASNRCTSGVVHPADLAKCSYAKPKKLRKEHVI